MRYSGFKTFFIVVLVALVGFLPASAYALNNGLAKTPPMGWNDWNAFGCNVSANLVKQTADFMVSSGMKAKGYKYVNIDDCWMKQSRDKNGHLVPNPNKFPNGIKGVANYVHSKGLKLGIYESAGSQTCAGYPGSIGHEYQDAEDFAKWGVDYLKYDNCGDHEGESYKTRYKTMRDALAATGRPIVYSLCEWGRKNVWTWGAGVGNLWRTTDDISDNYQSMLGIFHKNIKHSSYSQPGGWNDPDMLEIGNGGMTNTEYKTEFSLWAEMAAPLLAGTDLRKASPQIMAVYKNTAVIKVDQDRRGVQGHVVSNNNGHWVLSKPLMGGDRAVALFNESNQPAMIQSNAGQIGMAGMGLNGGGHHPYLLNNLWTHQKSVTAGDVSAYVPAHATVMYRVSQAKSNQAPAATTLAISASKQKLAHGQSTKVTVTLANQGLTAVTDVQLQLEAPSGWQVQSTSNANFNEVQPQGQKHDSVQATWMVTPSKGVTTGKSYKLKSSTSYASNQSAQSRRKSAQLALRIAPKAPTNNTYLSDLNWISSSNGWGPVEKDTSNGERDAHDGSIITLNRMTYQKGLGANAPSEIDYNVGGNCSTFKSDVGIDDEVGDQGSVNFQVWFGGNKHYDSGTLTGSDPAKHVSLDISKAQTLRLIITNGGDNKNYDHADWADARVVCHGSK